MRLYRRDVRRYGSTHKCPGCEAAIRGERAKHHREDCRQRLEKAIEDNEKGFARETERITKRIAERSEKELAQGDEGGGKDQ